MDEGTFFNNILEDPENISLRLVFADWLEENGQPDRAEFIRIQCQFPQITQNAQRRVLALREKELLEQHGTQWRSQFEDLPGQVVFRRGMPEGVMIDAEVFCQRAGELFERLPLLHVQLRNASQGLPGFLRNEWTPNLRSLSLCGERLSVEHVRQLFQSPALANLHELDLSGTVLCSKRSEALALNSNLPTLKRLFLEDTRIRASSLRKLVRSPFLGQLSEFWITASDFEREEWSALIELQEANPSLKIRSRVLPIDSPVLLQLVASSPVAQVWETLVVTTPSTLETVLESPHFTNVNHLHLSVRERQRKPLLNQLARSSLLGQLRSLDLSSGGWSNSSLDILANAPTPVRLESLDVSENSQITTKGLQALHEAGHLDGIGTLALSRTGCGPTLTSLLCQKEFLQLHTLKLSHIKGGEKILRGLAKKAQFRLEHVVAQGIPLVAETAKRLVRSTVFESLRSFEGSQQFMLGGAQRILEKGFVDALCVWT
ncbi:MAG: TIGR02996 domain-containing protein [Gemmataceae bacterium]